MTPPKPTPTNDMKKILFVITVLFTVGTGCIRFTSEPNEPLVELEPSGDYYVNPEPDPVITPEPEQQENEAEPPKTVSPDDPICVDACGNGSCEEIVCLGTGCPCAETPETCPADCR